jgi:uncharacterized protein YlxW (UPF0749 family)
VTRSKGPPRPVDASMTLLREVMERPLDPGYAAASAAGGRRPSPGSVALTLVLAVLAGYAFSVSVSSIRQPQRESTTVDNHLRTELEKRSRLVEAKESANAELRDADSLAQQNALGASGAALTSQVQTLGMATGEVPVSGPGLRFTVDDAPGRADAMGRDPRAAGGYDDGIVLDSDLQMIVNGLWAAGAEAIAINAHRLTALSAIRTAGQAILVDFRPLSPPYVIDAIGPASALAAGFASGPAGPYVQSMRDNSGIRVDITTQDSLALPGAGQLVLREATPTTTPTTTPATTPTHPSAEEPP